MATITSHVLERARASQHAESSQGDERLRKLFLLHPAVLVVHQRLCVYFYNGKG